MSRTRIAITTALAVLLLPGPVGAAVAEGTVDPSGAPSADASGSETPHTENSYAQAENQPPVAAPDAASVEAAGSVTVPVLDNDTDDGQGRPEGEEPRLEVTGATGAGDRVSFTDTDVTFTARPDDTGDFELSYEVSDGALTSTGQVTVTVQQRQDHGVTIRMAKRPVALRSYTLHGKAVPLAAGPALVTVQRKTPKGWVRYGRDRADAEGRYAVPFRTDKTGKRVFRAVARWEEGPKARSGTLRRRVGAVAAPKVSGPLTPRQVPHSWRSGCPVPPSKLRKIRINRLDFHKRVDRGAIVVRAGEVGDVVKVFKAALTRRFPIRLMKPTDAFYAGGRRTPMQSDKAAMRAGNTSAFNCRPVTGNPYRVSQHSYGNAVDINTIENPYVTGCCVYPAGSREYLRRSHYRRGMIVRKGVVASRFHQLGWLWGARWSHPDYQHFSSNGG